MDKEADMEGKVVENALAPGLEPTTSEVKVEGANHNATPSQTNRVSYKVNIYA